MKPSIRLIIGILSALLLGAGLWQARADTVTLKDGSVIHGKNVHIARGKVTITTEFGGDLSIKQDLVAAFETDEPVFVKTQDNSTMNGKVARKDSGLVVSGATKSYPTNVENIKTSWSQGEDPDIVALRHRWALEFTADIAGKSGNSSGFAGAFGAVATWKGPSDALKIYGAANHAVANGQRSEDAYKGGIEYNEFFSDAWSWYSSTELMQDNVKDISLRSSTLAGIGINAIRSKREALQFRAGLSYRYETYDTVPATSNFSAAGGSFGIVHRLDIAPFGVMNNMINYVPSFQDTANYIFDHDSNLTMPFGGSKIWSLRIGVINEYTSKPVNSTKRLDTTYYVRFVYDVL
jgi:putative salt-induced outer membrane protein YdiY